MGPQSLIPVYGGNTGPNLACGQTLYHSFGLQAKTMNTTVLNTFQQFEPTLPTSKNYNKNLANPGKW